eukprot:TRINITY_DN127458_c0_g1_i1.p2 TRINITY_DN127458_c0_g1~~TRINITY_DN127458_c0_g1_i1.p2  ORF type:complete len:196 (+),score=59.44 TRINITY_DN127458_c0_g1_i1:107-694(+)
MINYCVNNRAFAQQLKKEQKTRKVAAVHYYGKRGDTIVAPRVAKQYTAEEAAFLKFRKMYGMDPVPELSQSKSLKTLPSANKALGMAGAESLSQAAQTRSAASLPMANLGSTEGMLFFDNQRRKSMPATPSCRSASSRLSKNSRLWKEVENVVQEEVLRAMAPLQEQLDKEVAAKQKVMDAMTKAGLPLPAERGA